MTSRIKHKIWTAFLKDKPPKGIDINTLVKKESVELLLERLHPFSTDTDLMRLGPNGDGGYLIPNDIKGIKACFSPGVGIVSGFEKACAILGMDVFLADKSVDGPSEQHDRFFFIKKFVGPDNNDDYITMDGWVDSTLHGLQEDLMLQMDIEGAEYLSILNMSDGLMRRFRVIVVEFHGLNRLWNQEYFDLASCTFEKLLQYHTCVHIHPNNCCGIERLNDLEIPRVVEFTFYRNDRIKSKVVQTTFPHPLDFDNTNLPHITLPKSWYAPNESV